MIVLVGKLILSVSTNQSELSRMNLPKATWKRDKALNFSGLAAALMGSTDTPLWVFPMWLVGGVALNKISEHFSLSLALTILGVILATGVIWMQKRRHKNSEMVPELVEKAPTGKDGIILPLSTIALYKGSETDRSDLNTLIESALRSEENVLDDKKLVLLENRNLQSPFRAIEYHYEKGKLKECWLITTIDVTYPDGQLERGSWYAAGILEKWFLGKYPQAAGKVKFHHGPELQVHPRDYAKFWLMIDEIFERASYKAQNVIMDPIFRKKFVKANDCKSLPIQFL
jgi:hypothetical protein